MFSATNPPAGPLFVGGTGRSGTTIMGELLGQHAELALVPIELRFHVDGGGLGDLAAGVIDADHFEQRLRQKWFKRRPDGRGRPRGVHVVAPEAVMDEALLRLRERLAEDPRHACALFMDELLQPFVDRSGATTWVEMTPPNGRAADALCAMFPRSRLVHMVRDGRDVAASVARRTWGPDTIESALRWWARGMIEIHAAMSRADPERVLTVRLESLGGRRREEVYAQVLDFVGLAHDEGMDRFLQESIQPEKMHPGSWRKDLDEDALRTVEGLYAQQLERLETHGIRLPPAD